MKLRQLMAVLILCALAVWRMETRWGTQRAPPVLRLQLPFADGWTAHCAQGPDGWYTHQGLEAWDFVLGRHAPVTAVASGRVVHVVDVHPNTGRNDVTEANRIILDLGAGVYASYLHHQAGTARVKPGDRVFPGQVLALQGASGTYDPHIHLELHSPLHQDVAFITAEAPNGQSVGGDVDVASVNALVEAGSFEDSALIGEAFSDNGILLLADGPAFSFTANAERVLAGRVEQKDARQVEFVLWCDGLPDEYRTISEVKTLRIFNLHVQVPPTFHGPCWYRIAPAGVASHDGKRLPTRVQ